MAIIGHNGSGKSTLAKHFNAMLLPTLGHVSVLEMDTCVAEHVWDIRQKVGMVFQNPDNQLVATVVEEDVAFGPENLGLPQQQILNRVDEALKIVRMSEYSKAAPHLLSGGKSKGLLSQVLLRCAQNVLSSMNLPPCLTYIGREEVMDTILRLNRDEGITVVLITHFMHEAAMAERVIVMANGTIRMEGKPKISFAISKR